MTLPPAFPPQGWCLHLGAAFGQMSSTGQESEIKHSDLAREAAKAARAIGHKIPRSNQITSPAPNKS